MNLSWEGQLRETESSTEIYLGRERGFFTLRTSLFLPHPRVKIFPFFADAQNLENITPSWLRFRIVTPLPVFMQSGTIIEYKLRLHGIPVRWKSEITAWDPPRHFIDEQRRGPYRTWIHEHSFEEYRDGCMMHDYVRYAVTGGRLVNFVFVRRDVERIFLYRAQVLQRIFRVD
jgi:ligand-binding SRPBCC domain-containing protein